MAYIRAALSPHHGRLLGLFSSMSNWEFMYRLSGAPYDWINPNGLAFLICTVLPFIYLLAGLSWINKLIFIILTPAFIYALTLTGSRSGILGLMIIFLAILWKSKKPIIIGLFGVLLVFFTFPLLSTDTQDRYLSIFGMGEKNAATAEGRLQGIEDDFAVMLRRPVFGHGLGTSREANGHFRGVDQPSHNLYAEVGQELGFIGLVIFILFIKSIVSNFLQTSKVLQEKDVKIFLRKLVDALQVWLVMNLLFSIASYGLSSYEWYLFAGLSVVLQKLANESLIAVTIQSPSHSINCKGVGG